MRTIRFRQSGGGSMVGGRMVSRNGTGLQTSADPTAPVVKPFWGAAFTGAAAGAGGGGGGGGAGAAAGACAQAMGARSWEDATANKSSKARKHFITTSPNRALIGGKGKSGLARRQIIPKRLTRRR
jgi:hypothetical protein